MAGAKEIADYIKKGLDLIPEEYKDKIDWNVAFSGTATVWQNSKKTKTIKITDGKCDLGELKGPSEYKVEIDYNALLTNSETTYKYGLHFSYTWSFEVDDTATVGYFGTAKKKDLKHASSPIPITMVSTTKLEPFQSPKFVGFNIKLITGNIITKKNVFGHRVKCSFKPGIMKAKEKVKTLPVISFPIADFYGAYPTGKHDTGKIKKFKNYGDYRRLRKFYDALPELTKEMMGEGLKPGGKKIEITGYADNSGPASENDKLGERRAKDVMGYLMRWSGAPSSIFNIKGLGEGKKIEDRKGKEESDPSRRYVFVIVHAQVLK